MKLAEATRKRRLELGITQEDVVVRARQAGEAISLGTVRGVEQGHRAGLRRGPKRGLAAGLGWTTAHIDHLLADEFHVGCEECAGTASELAEGAGRTLAVMAGIQAAAIRIDGESEDVNVVVNLLDQLTENQRRIAFRGARAWVRLHPEYLVDLAEPGLSGVETIEHLDPDAFATLTADERVELMTHLAQMMVGPGVKAAETG